MNVTIKLENQFVVREENETPNVKILMLKGDKGDTGQDGTVSFDSLTEEQKAELKGDPGDDYVLTNQDKQDIADIVESETADDSGWVELDDYTVTANVDPADGQWHIRRIGHLVQLYLGFAFKAAQNNGAEVSIIQYLPEQFRPSKPVQLVCWAQTPFAAVRITEDGEVKGINRTGSQVSTTWWVRAHVTYMV